MSHLTENEKQALQLFKERLLEQFPGRIDSVKLFGSKARGEAHPESDVDVLVIMRRKVDWSLRWHVIDLSTDIFLTTNVDISPKIYSHEQITAMRRRRNMFLQSIEKDIVTL